jgi:hypothetical protein
MKGARHGWPTYVATVEGYRAVDHVIDEISKH